MTRVAHEMSAYVLDEHEIPVAFQGSMPVFPSGRLSDEKAIAYTVTEDDAYLLNQKTNQWDPFRGEHQFDDRQYQFDNWRKAWLAIENIAVPV